MSEEEKKAIETLDSLRVYNLNKFISDKEARAIMIILKLIEKQQKEIEDLKELLDDRLWNEHISKETEKIWKDKIREKIEFYKRYGKIKNSNEYVMSVEIFVLEELLEGDK